MNRADARDQEIAALRDRLSRLSEASLRITEDLDLDTVLQGVVAGARSLTGAGMGGITTLDEGGGLQDFITSGLTPDEHQRFVDLPGGPGFFAYLSRLPEPLRVADFSAYTTALGLPEIGPPLGPVKAFLGAPIRLRGQQVGNLYLSGKEGDGEFTPEDEDTLVMFAAQAAMAIANARRHRDEQRSRSDLETLINTAPVGVIVFDAGTGAPLSFNRETRRIVDSLRNPDQSPEDLLEVLTFRRADGREISLAEFPLAQALSSGETVRAEEIVIGVPDGRSVTTIINATPIPTEDGTVETVVVTLQDLTPLEELELQRAEFLAMVSHELRAPLTSIKGSAAAVLRTSSVLDAAEVQQFFRIIDGQADHMLDLIRDLMDAARIEAGTLSVALEPSDAAVLVDRARNTFLSGGGRSNIRIDLPPDLPRVTADRRRIVQVLGNLLSNAARHSPEASAIRLSAALEGVHVAFSVADDGVGISSERLPYLFRKFTRLEADDRGDGGLGAGLGLAICRGIVEAHGGRIRAESDGPGLGARFTFTLPAVEETATVPRTPALRSGFQGRERVRVLAVDDDPQALRYVRDALSEAGYGVAVTSDPEEALRLMAEDRPHLVLLDLVLPDTDGIELMRDILNIANVPVIFLSGYGRDQVIARAFDMGAEDYLVKPFSPTELVARIQAALRRRATPERMEPSEPYVRGELTIDYAGRRVTVAGQPVQLTATEYNLLAELSVNAGRVLTYEHLLRRVWGVNNSGSPRVIATHLMRLRRKLGEDADNPRYIFAEPRVGYRMGSADEPADPAV